ncbi:hypothetical protein [Methylobacterium aquaticum]|jgi:hypothetical protein|uniref:hypothetical protein n=1 Tax=Methylobacterium aquaticum TaxID=270351 RepID=UPI0012E15C61|nr:hypothetical protein [Methylobacterium aquaticum]
MDVTTHRRGINSAHDPSFRHEDRPDKQTKTDDQLITPRFYYDIASVTGVKILYLFIYQNHLLADANVVPPAMQDRAWREFPGQAPSATVAVPR